MNTYIFDKTIKNICTHNLYKINICNNKINDDICNNVYEHINFKKE